VGAITEYANAPRDSFVVAVPSASGLAAGSLAGLARLTPAFGLLPAASVGLVLLADAAQRRRSLVTLAIVGATARQRARGAADGRPRDGAVRRTVRAGAAKRGHDAAQPPGRPAALFGHAGHQRLIRQSSPGARRLLSNRDTRHGVSHYQPATWADAPSGNPVVATGGTSYARPVPAISENA
jgi:hypothetical protein